MMITKRGSVNSLLRSLLFLITTDAMVNAQDQPPTTKYLDEKFGSCLDDPCSLQEECCRFEHWYDAGPDQDFEIIDEKVVPVDNGKRLRKMVGGKWCMSEEEKNRNWYGKYQDKDDIYWDWVCQRPPDGKSAKADELVGSYPEAANIFMLITYQMGLFWILGLPIYMMMAPISSLWWSIELVVVMFSGGTFADILKLSWINFLTFWCYVLNTITIIIPGLNFLSGIFGFIVYVYVAFQY